MKLLGTAAVLGLASANGAMRLDAMNALSDECAGCENAPEPQFTCDNPPCDSEVCGQMATGACEGDSCAVDCSLDNGYYRDNANCRGYCYCAGDQVSEGTGVRVPSRWNLCPAGSFWDADCGGHFKELANGMGWEGGCCNHAAHILNFQKGCDGGCERLSKYFCAKSNTCSWDDACNCCKEGPGEPAAPSAPENPTKAACNGRAFDATFIVDGSGSVGPVNFQASLDFVKKIASFFDLGADKTIVNVVQYSVSHTIEFTMQDDYDTIAAKLDAIPYQGKSTRTGKCLKFWKEERPNYKRGVPQSCMVLTDGVSYDNKANDVSIRGPELQEDTHVIAVGVGAADPAQLAFIATDPDADNVYNSKDWGYLDGIAEAIAKKMCESNVGGPNNLHG